MKHVENNAKSEYEEEVELKQKVKKVSPVQKQEDNKPKKRIIDFNLSWGVYLVIFLLSFLIGRLVIESEIIPFGGNDYIYIIIIFVSGFLGNVALYGIGKMLFGILAGYRILILEFLGLKFHFYHEKMHISFKLTDVLEGKVRMTPRKEKVHTPLYLCGGLITFFIMTAVLITVSYFINNQVFLSVIYTQSFGLLLMLLELIPLRMDFINDMFILCHFKNKNNRIAYESNLKNLAHEIEGTDYEVVTFEKYDSVFKIEALIYQYYQLLYTDKIKEAEGKLDLILSLKHIATDDVITQANAEKLYLLLLRGDSEAADKVYIDISRTMVKTMKSSVSSWGYRTSAIIVALLEAKESETIDIFKEYAEFIEEGIHNQTEKALMGKAIALIKEKKTDWELAEKK